MPTARGGLTAKFVNGILYAIGGREYEENFSLRMKHIIHKLIHGQKKHQCQLQDTIFHQQ